MEKFHLPVSSSERAFPPEKKAETLEKDAERSLKAFVNQRYPLSKKGEKLKERIQHAIDEGDASEVEKCRGMVPTVERPRMELFEDLHLPEEELRQVLFDDLENVQVSKGCRHQCTFCAAEAGKKITFMPFAAILKIAQIRKPYTEQKLEAWRKWASLIKEKIGVDVTSGSYGIYGDQMDILQEEFQRFPERDILLKRKRPTPDSEWPEKDFPSSFHSEVKKSLVNYYDSDPFDYRDSTFLHEDGTVADYGDVFNALASVVGPIHITTAGWPITDKIAQRGAEKIIESCKADRGLLASPRISVNRHEATARRDFGKYLRDMENVLRTLNPVNPEVLFFYDKDDPEDAEFIEKIVTPLRNLMKQLSPSGRQPSERGLPIYKDSGRTADTPYQDDHHDLMACMPGVHLWPDGTIARQADQQWIPQKDNPNAKSFLVPEGSRPTPTDKKLFIAPKKKR